MPPNPTSPRPGFTRPATRRRAFSLVEVLIVVAVIGILAAVAVIPFARVSSDTARENRAQRNAQNLVSVFQSARAAEIDFLVAEDITATVNRIVDGEIASTGAFKGGTFSVPNLSPEQIADAVKYLEIDNDALVYNAAGSP